MPHTHIAALESRWYPDRNISVRGMFDLVVDIHTNSPHNYDYEMVGSRAAFVEALTRYMTRDTVHYVSVNCHGNDHSLHMTNEETITQTVLRNCLIRAGDQMPSQIAGVHFGACSFVTQQLCEFLYDMDISPWWIAGYSRTIGFIESTALDFLFFNKIIAMGIRNPDMEEMDKIREIAQQLIEEIPGLIRKLQFHIFFRNDQMECVEDLLAQTHE